MADHAFFFGLQHGIIDTALIPGSWNKGDVVALIEVQIIGLKIIKGSMKVLPEVFGLLRYCLASSTETL